MLEESKYLKSTGTSSFFFFFWTEYVHPSSVLENTDICMECACEENKLRRKTQTCTKGRIYLYTPVPANGSLSPYLCWLHQTTSWCCICIRHLTPVQQSKVRARVFILLWCNWKTQLIHRFSLIFKDNNAVSRARGKKGETLKSD